MPYANSRARLPRCPRGCVPTTSSMRDPYEKTCECFNGFVVDWMVAARPVPFMPGTPEKAAVISARIEYGFELWLPGDGQDKSHLGFELLLPTKRELLLIEAAG